VTAADMPDVTPLPDRVATAILDVASPRCVYVYDRITLVERARAVREALPAGSALLYAVKANGSPDILDALAAVVDGFDVASGGELALARIARAGRATVAGSTLAAAGAAAGLTRWATPSGDVQEIHFSGPGKTDAELAAGVEAEATVTVESMHELRRLAVAAESSGVRVNVTLRVNRMHDPITGSHTMTGTPTPFGIDEAEIGGAIELVWQHPALRLRGFALHAVSNNLDAAAHARFVVDAVQWSAATAERHGMPLSVINVGGGFGVDYMSTDAFDLTAFGKALSSLALPSAARLIFELGRFLAADAGWYAAEVLDLKRNHGRWFAVLRGGTHHFRLPAAWGYSHPFTVLPVDEWTRSYPRPEVRDVPVDAVGELCTPRDVLTRDQTVPRLRVGDVLVFARAGAYGWDISHHDYLRHDPPTFVITG
jgi:diaminopimelate decarboxylase